MATHTNSGGNYGRKFSIGRENGQQNKDGVPHFFEWLQQLPENRTGRKFETRPGSDGNPKYYELFRAVDGYLTAITTEEKTIQNKTQLWLVLHLSDGGEDYRIEVGPTDNRYSMDVMKRLLDPNFNPAQKVRFSPYSLIDGGKTNIGLSVMNGPDTKLIASRYDPQFPSRAYNSNLEGIPQAVSTLHKGETLWDFTPVSEWLLEQVRTKVIPRLAADPISAPAQTINYPTASSQFPEYPTEPPAEMDALPF